MSRKALDELRKIRAGVVNPLEGIGEDEDAFVKEVNDQEFEELRQRRTAKGFIVDDDGGDYLETEDDVGEVHFTIRPEEDDTEVVSRPANKKRTREVDIFAHLNNKRTKKRTHETKHVTIENPIDCAQRSLRGLLVPKTSSTEGLIDDEFMADLDKEAEAPKFKNLIRRGSTLKVPARQTSVELDCPPDPADALTQECEGEENAIGGQCAGGDDTAEPQYEKTIELPPESIVVADPSEDDELEGIEDDLLMDKLLNNGPLNNGQSTNSISQTSESLPVAQGTSLTGYLMKSSTGQAWLPFFVIDVTEVNGDLCLFGKVMQTGASQSSSCSIVIRDMVRNIFIRIADQPADLDDPDACKSCVMKLKSDIARIFAKINSEKVIVRWKKRKVILSPPGKPIQVNKEELYVKLTLPAKTRLPHEDHFLTSGFTHVYGIRRSAVELFLIKRKVMGPSWLQIAEFDESKDRQSSCRFEVSCGYKMVSPMDVGGLPAIPPLSSLALTIKSVKDEKNETMTKVFALNMAGCNDCTADRKLEDLVSRVIDASALYVSPTVCADAKHTIDAKGVNFLTSNFKEMIEFFIHQVATLDPDVIVCHDFYGEALPIILQALTYTALRAWRRLSRLMQSNTMPLTNQNLRQMSMYDQSRLIFSGRLVCDTNKMVRETLGSRTDYALQSLIPDLFASTSIANAGDFLVTHQQLYDLIDHQVKTKSALTIKDVTITYPSLVPLISNTLRHSSNEIKKGVSTASMSALVFRSLQQECRIVFYIAQKLQMLKLTLELAQVAGSVWDRSLYCQRAERNEYLILHNCRLNKILPPDNAQTRAKVAKVAHNDDDNDPTNNATSSGPAYEGGLVLEPLSGYYDTYILYLDFASLYPSIIQEFNLCFTTCFEMQQIENGNEDFMRSFKYTGDRLALLPTILHNLVKKRREVKTQLRNAKDLTIKANLEIKQKALKLVANSIYGSLGYQYFRFYAPHIAATVTAWGRHILMSTRDKVEKTMDSRVVYGDTDSIMVDSGIRDEHNDTRGYYEALERAQKITQEINKHHNRLELEVEAVFRKLLLLKKKKYAALRVVDIVQRKYATDIKGIDIVRRDWCGLTKQIGTKFLDMLFESSDDDTEALAGKICSMLEDLRLRMDKNAVPLEDFVITKALTKLPSNYVAPKQHTHVAVAMEMQAKGSILHPGLEIPFLICVESRDGGTLSDRAWHPLDAKAKQLHPDVEWYKGSQILPPLQRLCQFIPSLNNHRLADSLGCPVKHTYVGIDGPDKVAEDTIIDLSMIKTWSKSTGASDEVSVAEEVTCAICNSPRNLLNVLAADACQKCEAVMPIRAASLMARDAARRCLYDYYKYATRCLACSSVSESLSRTCDTCGKPALKLCIEAQHLQSQLTQIVEGLISREQKHSVLRLMAHYLKEHHYETPECVARANEVFADLRILSDTIYQIKHCVPVEFINMGGLIVKIAGRRARLSFVE